MNSMRQRYIDTILFRHPDKVPLSPGHPRQSTLAAWHRQGLPHQADYIDTAMSVLNINPQALLRGYSMDVNFKMIPEFEVKVLQHSNGHYIISDWMGAVTEISDQYDESYLRTAKDFVTRKWHRFPVENRSDWLNMRQRYLDNQPGRISPDLAEETSAARTQDKVVSLSFNGVFWQLREWCGFENLCLLMAEDPVFVMEMADFWGQYVWQLLKKVLAQAVPDRVFISEDMAYKAHSMISPAMTRQFIMPQYRLWVPTIKQAGCPVIEMDSDGCIDELIPLWIEAGINCCSPAEVAAGCDIKAYRDQFGRQMAYMQGIDKRLIALGGQPLINHIMDIVPYMFKEGGYIPGCDHGVPPDISWDNYLELTRILARLSGW